MAVDRIIAARIRELRHRKNMTQAQLAERAGLAEVTVSGLERGRLNPRLSTLVAIARALGVSFESLVPAGAREENLSPRRASLLARIEVNLRELSDTDLEFVADTIETMRRRRRMR